MIRLRSRRSYCWHKNSKGLPALGCVYCFCLLRETDGSGSQSFVQYFQKNHARKYQKVAVIIGEPTDLQTIEIGHRGNMFLQVATHGDSGHGSQPQQIKTHAVLEHVKIIKKIITLGKSLSEKYRDPVLGSPSFCLTGIQTDTSSPNTVPSVCASTWDVRTTPTLHAQVIPILQKTLGKEDHLSLNPRLWAAGILHRDTLQTSSEGTGIRLPASNTFALYTAGISGLRFGPAKKTIHKPNEYVQLQKVDDAIEIYSGLIQAW